MKELIEKADALKEELKNKIIYKVKSLVAAYDKEVHFTKPINNPTDKSLPTLGAFVSIEGEVRFFDECGDFEMRHLSFNELYDICKAFENDKYSVK